jgi:serine/threonine-protein kinase
VLNADEAAGLLYYTMPFVEGESLRAKLDLERQLSIDESLRLTRDIAEALAYAHGRHVIHRDVKPENVLLSDGHALLTDFGISKAIEGSAVESVTATGVSVGTPAYMAPEQASGERATDQRADIYALGCVLYELLTGQPPYSGPSMQSVVAQHVAAPIPSASVLRPAVTPELEAVIARAMAKVPADRFPTATAFLSALTAVVEDGASNHTSVRRKPAVRFGWAVVIVAALALGGVSLYRLASRPAVDANLLAVAPFQVLDSRFALWREGMVDVLSRNLDGAGTLRSVPPTLVIRRWTGRADRESAVSLGRNTGAAFVVYGALARSGQDTVRLTVEIADVPRSRNVATLELRGPEDRLDRLADSAALGVLRELGRERAAGLTRIPSSGTHSFAALKAFLEGEQYYRRNAFDSALVGYREAIRLDSSFAPAYRGAAWSIMDAGVFLDPVAIQYASLAARYNHGLSYRDSVLIAADSLLVPVSDAVERRLDAKPAERHLIATLEREVTRRADDPMLWYALGNAKYYFGYQFGETREARPAFERAIQLDSAFLPSLTYAAFLALAADDTVAARRHVDRWILLRPTESTPKIVSAILGDTEPVTREAQRFLDTTSTSSLASGLLVVFGWSDARARALAVSRAILRRKVSRADFRFGSADVSQLASAFAIQYLTSRGLIREAYPNMSAVPDSAFGWADTRPVVAAQLAVIGAMAPDSAGALVRRMPMRDAWRMAEVRAWWRLARDTVSLLEAARFGDSVAATGRASRDENHYRVATSAALAIARGDSSRGLTLLRQLSDTTDPFTWADQLGHAELLAAAGDTVGAFTLLRRLNDVVSGFGTTINYRPLALRFHLLLARAAETAGDRATATAEYGFVARRLSQADPELRPLANEAESGLKRVRAHR